MPSRLVFFRDAAQLTPAVPLGAFRGFSPSEVFATQPDPAGEEQRSKPFFGRALTRTVRAPSATHHRVVQPSPSSVFLLPGG